MTNMTNFELKVIDMVRQHYNNIGDPIDNLANEQVKKLTIYTDYSLKLAVKNLKNDLVLEWQEFIKRFI
jgi:hypothetical protein